VDGLGGWMVDRRAKIEESGWWSVESGMWMVERIA